VSAQSLLVVGDLHMGAGDGDPFHRDRDLARFLAEMARRRDDGPGPPRLVILGDLLDFPAAAGGRPPDGEAAALEALERIAAAHASALDALAAYLAAGATIDLVAGNHDADLARPAVLARLRELLGGPSARLAFHPWILHVPGVLYAEHGHQHHDLNAFATPLAPWRPYDRDRLDLPPGALAEGPRAAALLALSAARSARRRRTYRATALPTAAAGLGLSPAALRAIDAATPRGPLALASRMAHRVTARGAQHRAARRIHDVLQAEGRSVPCYAFAHTHVAERRPVVPGAAETLYVNAGTWSNLRRDGGAPRLTYVEVAPAGAARLLEWPPDVRGGWRSRRPPAAGRRETAPAPR
jgi:UDP-2,3-diacylglucosamine pyrophosphatase LpxH